MLKLISSKAPAALGKEILYLLTSFVLAVEALSVEMEIGVMKGDLKLFNASSSTPSSHLIFADDVLAFLKEDISSFKAVEDIFTRFALLSCLHLNKEKAKLYLNSSYPTKDKIFDELGTGLG